MAEIDHEPNFVLNLAKDTVTNLMNSKIDVRPQVVTLNFPVFDQFRCPLSLTNAHTRPIFLLEKPL